MKRILICSAMPYLPIAQGKTFDTYFKNWRKEDLFQIFSNDLVPSKGHCAQLWRITDSEMLRKILQPRKPVGRLFRYDELPDPNEYKTNPYRTPFGKKNFFKRMVRHWIWGGKRWQSKELLDRVDEFNPEVIFLYWHSDSYMLRIADFFSRRYDLPMIICNGDDYLLGQKSDHNPFHRIYYRRYNKIALPIAKDPRNRTLFISEKMRQAYWDAFHAKGKVIHVSPDIPPKPMSSPKKITKLCYFGNLYFKRIETILSFAEAALQAHYDLVIDIYSYWRVDKSIAGRLARSTNVHLHDGVPFEQVCEIADKADATIVAEALSDPKTINLVYFALSTKVGDALMFGKPIVAIGNSDTGAVGYLKSKGCALVFDETVNFVSGMSMLEDADAIRGVNMRIEQVRGDDYSFEKNNRLFHEVVDEILSPENENGN